MSSTPALASRSPREISLITATYNWPAALDLILCSVRAQREMPHEVLIADDDSGDETREVIASQLQGFPVPLVHVWHEHAGFRLAAIRNKSIAAVRTSREDLAARAGPWQPPECAASTDAFAVRGRPCGSGSPYARLPHGVLA